MVGFRRLFYWPVATTAYWFCALWLLFRVSPIYEDGFGPSASFYLGNSPTTYRQLLYPYWIAASIITFVGCGLTTWLVRLWRPRRSRLFLVSSVMTLVSLLLVGAISDVGISRHIWRGPTMYGGLSYLWPFLKFLVPMSLFAGVLALARDRLDR
jgi:hypothetical protein